MAMPLIFILVLGITLGEGFGQSPSKRIRVSVCVLDEGPPRFFDRTPILREHLGRFAATPIPGNAFGGSLGFVAENHRLWFPHDSWAKQMLDDLGKTASIQVELVNNRAEAEELVRSGKRAAVLVLGPEFSRRVARCSFLSPGWRRLSQGVDVSPARRADRAGHDGAFRRAPVGGCALSARRHQSLLP